MSSSFLFGFSYLSPNSKKILSFFGKSYFDTTNQTPLIETGLKQVSINDRYNSYDRLSWYFLNPVGIGSYYFREEGYLRSQLTGQSQVWFNSRYSNITKTFIPNFAFESSSTSFLVSRKKTSIHLEKFKNNFDFELSSSPKVHSNFVLRNKIVVDLVPKYNFYYQLRRFWLVKKVFKRKRVYLRMYKNFLLLKQVKINFDIFKLFDSNFILQKRLFGLLTLYSSSFFKQYGFYKPFIHRSYFIQKKTTAVQTFLTSAERQKFSYVKVKSRSRRRFDFINILGLLGHPSFFFNTLSPLRVVRKRKHRIRHIFLKHLRRFVFLNQFFSTSTVGSNVNLTLLSFFYLKRALSSSRNLFQIKSRRYGKKKLILLKQLRFSRKLTFFFRLRCSLIRSKLLFKDFLFRSYAFQKYFYNFLNKNSSVNQNNLNHNVVYNKFLKDRLYLNRYKKKFLRSNATFFFNKPVNFFFNKLLKKTTLKKKYIKKFRFPFKLYRLILFKIQSQHFFHNTNYKRRYLFLKQFQNVHNLKKPYAPKLPILRYLNYKINTYRKLSTVQSFGMSVLNKVKERLFGFILSSTEYSKKIKKNSVLCIFNSAGLNTIKKKKKLKKKKKTGFLKFSKLKKIFKRRVRNARFYFPYTFYYYSQFQRYRNFLNYFSIRFLTKNFTLFYQANYSSLIGKLQNNTLPNYLKFLTFTPFLNFSLNKIRQAKIYFKSSRLLKNLSFSNFKKVISSNTRLTLLFFLKKNKRVKLFSSFLKRQSFITKLTFKKLSYFNFNFLKTNLYNTVNHIEVKSKILNFVKRKKNFIKVKKQKLRNLSLRYRFSEKIRKFNFISVFFGNLKDNNRLTSFLYSTKTNLKNKTNVLKFTQRVLFSQFLVLFFLKLFSRLAFFRSFFTNSLFLKTIVANFYFIRNFLIFKYLKILNLNVISDVSSANVPKPKILNTVLLTSFSDGFSLIFKKFNLAFLKINEKLFFDSVNSSSCIFLDNFLEDFCKYQLIKLN